MVTYFVTVVAVVDCVHIQPAKSQPLTTVLDMWYFAVNATLNRSPGGEGSTDRLDVALRNTQLVCYIQRTFSNSKYMLQWESVVFLLVCVN